jgi:hypothetical protein
MLSDALQAYNTGLSERALEALAFGCLSPQHAGQFKAFVKLVRGKFRLAAILKGEQSWPARPEDRDVLYFLAQSFRAQLVKELPAEREAVSGVHRERAHRGKALLKDLAAISLEMAQLVVATPDDGEPLPGWLMVEIVRDLPRLVEAKRAS